MKKSKKDDSLEPSFLLFWFCCSGSVVLVLLFWFCCSGSVVLVLLFFRFFFEVLINEVGDGPWSRWAWNEPSNYWVLVYEQPVVVPQSRQTLQVPFMTIRVEEQLEQTESYNFSPFSSASVILAVLAARLALPV